jgi:hypothetical protein
MIEFFEFFISDSHRLISDFEPCVFIRHKTAIDQDEMYFSDREIIQEIRINLYQYEEIMRTLKTYLVDNGFTLSWGLYDNKWFAFRDIGDTELEKPFRLNGIKYIE